MEWEKGTKLQCTHWSVCWLLTILSNDGHLHWSFTWHPAANPKWVMELARFLQDIVVMCLIRIAPDKHFSIIFWANANSGFIIRALWSWVLLFRCLFCFSFDCSGCYSNYILTSYVSFTDTDSWLHTFVFRLFFCESSRRIALCFSILTL